MGSFADKIIPLIQYRIDRYTMKPTNLQTDNASWKGFMDDKEQSDSPAVPKKKKNQLKINTGQSHPGRNIL